LYPEKFISLLFINYPDQSIAEILFNQVAEIKGLLVNKLILNPE